VSLDEVIQESDERSRQAYKTQTDLKNKRESISKQFKEVMKRFGDCKHPIFDATPAADAEMAADFDSAIALYLHQQRHERELAQQLESLFIKIQSFFGDRYHGTTETDTIRNLKEELEAVDKREELLKHEWNAHIQGLKSRFKHVLDDLAQIETATTRLTKSFGQVQVSDLKAIKLSVERNMETVGVINRLAGLEEFDLWADQAPLETALQRVREWTEKPPIKIADLFTLVISVTGADGKVKHFRDFRQIESDGTTVAIKVLFNLLVLKSQLRKDDVAVPFFLDEVEKLDAANRGAVLQTAKSLGFIAITAAPSAVAEVNACYFLEKRPSGYVKLTSDHRLELQPKARTHKRG